MSKIFIKSCLDGMNELDTNSIDLIFTSPPYWDLVDYKTSNQLGLGLTFETYLAFMDKFLLSSARVLKFDCFLVLNIADIRKNLSNSLNARPKIYSIQAHVIPKLESLGIDLHAHIIWKKKSVKANKKKIIYGSSTKDFVYPPFVYNDLDIEHILVFRKPGPKRKFLPLDSRLDKIAKKTLSDEYSSLWEFDETVKNKDHPAKFPLVLAERVIQLYSLTNDTVLDPFIGSGTTALGCIKLNRNFIGYELNKNYLHSSLSHYIQE